MSTLEEGADEGSRASTEDIRRILGNLDPAQVFDILCQRPTVLDLKQALLWLSGDTVIFGQNAPLQSPAGEIMSILAADEQEDQ